MFGRFGKSSNAAQEALTNSPRVKRSGTKCSTPEAYLQGMAAQITVHDEHVKHIENIFVLAIISIVIIGGLICMLDHVPEGKELVIASLGFLSGSAVARTRR